jgi:hypothetical protein
MITFIDDGIKHPVYSVYEKLFSHSNIIIENDVYLKYFISISIIIVMFSIWLMNSDVSIISTGALYVGFVTLSVCMSTILLNY